MASVVYGLIAVILIIAALFYFYPSLFYPVPNVKNAGVFDLSKTASIFDATAVNSFETDTASTVQGFFFINPLQRTATALTCDTKGNPRCDTGRFDTCVCDTLECSNCTRNGYMPILQIGDTCSLEILSAPDAGRQGKAMTQLSIRTTSNSYEASGSRPTTGIFVEVLPLPPLPLQRWVMITIVREGRRFSIYYDKTVVLSQKTEHTISATVTQDDIRCGSSMLNGKATFFSLINSAESGSKIASKYAELTDTRGVPITNLVDIKNLTMSIPIPVCPSGFCKEEPTLPPAQPWLEWDTQYA